MQKLLAFTIFAMILSGSQALAQGTARSTANNAPAADATAVKFIPSSDVAAAFDKSAVIYEENGHNYKILGGRREKPGMAELHEKDTDLFYVLEGAATFVTGGKMSDAKKTAPDEVRGSAVEGGEARRLAKGDVIIIPAGVPHWFKSIEMAPFLYYVVKVPR